MAAVTAEPSALEGEVTRLRELAEIAGSLDLPRGRDEALAAAERVSAGQFYVACVGQFKRGKSTLINALLDDPVLPSGIVPITAVPTVVRYGAQRTARVRLTKRVSSEGGSSEAPDAWRWISPEDLPLYVSEEHNPENQRGVDAVEVFVPRGLLQKGMCLVDTPGLGSVFESSSALTRSFVPHIDAAIVVIGADPPIAGGELDLVADVARHVAKLVVVLNKCDRVTLEERTVAAAYARKVIQQRIHRPIDRIYEVSATGRLSGTGQGKDWNALVAHLESLATDSGAELVRDAGRRAVARLSAGLLAAARQERAALLRSNEENERHMRGLEAVIREGERAVQDLTALFAAEQQRLSARFSLERAEFLAYAGPHARELFAAELSRVSSRFGPTRRRDMMHAAQDVVRRVLYPWLEQQQQLADVAYREAMSRLVAIASGFLDRLADSGTPELAVLRGAIDSGARLGGRSKFVFNEVIHVAEPASPLRFAADVLLGLVASGALRTSAEKFLGWLLEMNSSRVRYDLEERTAESGRELESEVRMLLREVESRATRDLARASEVRAGGSATFDREVHRLQEMEEHLARLGDARP
jgi:GTP-binding protein EngB required for normal cell division